jgi:hypothetical protein
MNFRVGMNQSRARDRLISLSKLLPGEIGKVKERQFFIGYEIERSSLSIPSSEQCAANRDPQGLP